MSSLDFHTLVTSLCGDASAPLIGFLLLRLAPVTKEGPKTGVVELSWTGFVCRLRGVLPPCIQGQVSVRWRFAWFAGRFRCLFFWWISLVWFAESQGFCCLSGRWFVPYLFKRLLWWSGRMY